MIRQSIIYNSTNKMLASRLSLLACSGCMNNWKANTKRKINMMWLCIAFDLVDRIEFCWANKVFQPTDKTNNRNPLWMGVLAQNQSISSSFRCDTNLNSNMDVVVYQDRDNIMVGFVYNSLCCVWSERWTLRGRWRWWSF